GVHTCDRTISSVTIHITGTNDAAVLSSATVDLTETNSATDISTSGTLTVSDVDSAETFQAQTDQAGTYGKFSIDTAGHWSYVADNAHNEFVDGVTYTDTFGVASADGTSTSVTIHITGTNDEAVISGGIHGNATEAGGVSNDIPGASATGTLTDADVDNAANTF